MKKRNRTHHVWGAFLRIHLNPAGSLSKDRTPVTPAQKKKKLAVLVHVSSILHGSTDPRLTVGLGCLLNSSVLVLGSCSFPSRREKPKNEWAVHLPLRDVLVIPVMVTYWGLDWALFTKRLYCGMHGCTTWPNNHKTTNSVKVWYLELSVDVTPNFWTALPQQLSHTPQLILSTGDTTPQASYIVLASTFL